MEEEQWTVVKSRTKQKPEPKKKTKAKESKNQQQQQKSKDSNNVTKEAFHGFDLFYKEKIQKEKEIKNTIQEEEIKEEITTPDTPPNEEAENNNEVKKEPKKKEKKKKENKNGASSSSSKQKNQIKEKPLPKGISSEELKELIETIEAKYFENEVAKMEVVADRLITVYKDYNREFFSKICSNDITNTVDILEGTLMPEIFSQLSAYLSTLTTLGLSSVLTVFITALFEQIGKSDYQNLNTNTGLLCLIHVICRICPTALILFLREFFKDSKNIKKLSSPKYHLIFWMAAQSEKAAYGTMLCFWLELILPLILNQGKKDEEDKKKTTHDFVSLNMNLLVYTLKYGMHPQSPKSTNEIEFSKEFLKAVKSSSYTINRVCSSYEDQEDSKMAIISEISLINIIKAIFVDKIKNMPVTVQQTLKKNYSILKQWTLQTCNNETLLLNSFELIEKMNKNKDILKEVTELVCQCLYVDNACFDIWIHLHEKHINASSKILQFLSSNEGKNKIKSFQYLLKSHETSEAFSDMCQKLIKRNDVLKQGSKDADLTVSSLKSLDNVATISMKKKNKSLFFSLFKTFLISLILSGTIAVTYVIGHKEAEIFISEFFESDNGKEMKHAFFELVENMGLEEFVKTANEIILNLKSHVDDYLEINGF